MVRENQADAEPKGTTTASPTQAEMRKRDEETQANANGNLPIKASRPANPYEALEATKEEAATIVGNAGAMIEAAQAQGFHGFVPDPTPNENYTVTGVTSNAPTPETDKKLRTQARSRQELPEDIPFMPKNQEQFDQAIEYRKGQEQEQE